MIHRLFDRRGVLRAAAAWSVLAWMAATSAAESAGDRFYEPGRVLEVRIELDPAGWNELRRQQPDPGVFSGQPKVNTYTWFPADFWLDGQKIANVGVRKKGFFGSNDMMRPSLKIDFEEFQDQEPIEGLKRLTLNNNKQDRSQFSQYLAYTLFRKAGLPAPRSNWAHVVVNGQDLGLYTNVEPIKKPFLERAFGDKSGNLYEGALTDFHPEAVDNLELKTNEDDNDGSDVRAITDLLASPGELDTDALGRLLDLEAFTRYWALEGLTGFWDGYAANQNNYHVYFDPGDSGRGHFIPWGADALFAGQGPFGGQAGVVSANGILANRLYHTKGWPEQYRQAMDWLLDEVWDEDALLEDVNTLEPQLAPYLHPSQADTAQATEALRRFITQRRRQVQRAWEAGPPRVPPTGRTPGQFPGFGGGAGFAGGPGFGAGPGMGPFGPPGAQPMGPGGGMRAWPAPPSALLSALDLDGDGALTPDELSRAAESLERLDRDGDGVLSASELAAPVRPR